MKKSVNAVLRERIDPERQLPHIRLVSQNGEGDTGITGYRAFFQQQNVGSVLLRRMMPQVGLETLQIEELRVGKSEDPIRARCAVELAILTKCSVENLVLVSDSHGITFEETAMWYRLSGTGVATIVEPFMPRAELLHGEAIWDGQAFAPPIGVAAER